MEHMSEQEVKIKINKRTDEVCLSWITENDGNYYCFLMFHFNLFTVDASSSKTKNKCRGMLS